eukprot:SAG31_NODE_2394_length_5793_cov_2.006674_2_plen_306_part_00
MSDDVADFVVSDAALQQAEAAHETLLSPAAALLPTAAGSIVTSGTLQLWDSACEHWVPRTCALRVESGDDDAEPSLQLRFAERRRGGRGGNDTEVIRLHSAAAVVEIVRGVWPCDEERPVALAIMTNDSHVEGAEPSYVSARYEQTLLDWFELISANLCPGAIASATPSKQSVDDYECPRAPSPVGAALLTEEQQQAASCGQTGSHAVGALSSSQLQTQVECRDDAGEVYVLSGEHVTAAKRMGTPSELAATTTTAAARLQSLQKDIEAMGGLPSAGNANWETGPHGRHQSESGESDSDSGLNLY